MFFHSTFCCVAGYPGLAIARFKKFLRVKWLRSYRRAGEVVAAVVLSFGLVLGLANPGSATSPPSVVQNVGIVSIVVDVSGNWPVRHLIDERSVRYGLIEHFVEGLLEERPDIDVTAGHVALNPIGLWILIDVTITTEPHGADDLPCCLGAITVTLVRNDPARYGTPSNVFETVSTEPFFAGADPDGATATVIELLEAELEWLLYWLTRLGPHHAR